MKTKESPEAAFIRSVRRKALLKAGFEILREHASSGSFRIQPPDKKQKPVWFQPGYLDGEKRALPPGVRNRDIKRVQTAEARRWDRHAKKLFGDLTDRIREKHPDLLGDKRKTQKLVYDTLKRPLKKN